MRGRFQDQGGMFSYIQPEKRSMSLADDRHTAKTGITATRGTATSSKS